MKLKPRTNKKTLSEKIAESLVVKPKQDIEEDVVFNTKPRILQKDDFESSDSDVDTAISDFRRANVKQLSEISKKYEGEIVSRENANSSEESSDDIYNKKSNDEKEPGEKYENSSVENDSNEQSDFDHDDYGITSHTNDEITTEENDSSDENGDNEEGYDISQMEEPMKEEFEHVKKSNVSEEVMKGISVRNQLQVWESLLEMRIHIQKCLNVGNRMPFYNKVCDMKSVGGEGFTKVQSDSKKSLSSLLDKLLSLQNLLLSKYPETKDLSKGKLEPNRNESDEEIPSDTEDEEDIEKEEKEPKKHKKRKLSDYEKCISENHKRFKSYRDSVITKWNEKTRMVNSSSMKGTQSNTILQQIDYILSDKDKLIKKTQLKRSEYDIVGYTNESETNNEEGMNGRKDCEEFISEIFDDSDFYHQLLRELIECKSSDVTDPVQLSRQWIMLQQMRSKMKRKVDTKATKGRRIKYVVHNKLINYMAPEKSSQWSDEMRNELYSSLFGKMFEYNSSQNTNSNNK